MPYYKYFKPSPKQDVRLFRKTPPQKGLLQVKHDPGAQRIIDSMINADMFDNTVRMKNGKKPKTILMS